MFFQPLLTSSAKNIFDNLPALSTPPKSNLRDELDCYLSTDPEHVTDALAWWYDKQHVYLHLHHMALDYLTIPGKFKFHLVYMLIPIQVLIIIVFSYIC